VRTTVVLGVNLVLGTGALAWVLWGFGRPALALLAAGAHPSLLAAYVAAFAVSLGMLAFRWQGVLAGLGLRVALARLTVFRAAGQSLSGLIPSAKLGGEPLRAWLLARDRVAAGTAIASVAVDRALEMGAGAPFTFLFAALLLRRGVPELQGAFVGVTLGVAALALGIGVTVRRLGRGEGLVTAVARATGLDRLGIVRGQLGVLADAEEAAGRLVRQPRRLAWAFALGAAANVAVCVEYALLLAAFGLPASPLAVVAAMFAAGAAHALPVPGAVGTLEGAQMWIFSMLGHPPEVGLAVGLAVRLRELVWMLPGLVYLAARGLVAPLLRVRPA
jgi:uncharacterized protein (TIRG00374 family)